MVMVKSIAIIFLIFPLYLPASALSEDTIPPSAKWLQPLPYSVIGSNIFRIIVQAEDSGSGIDSINLYVNYQLRTGVYIQDSLIATLKKTPYEFLWDCHHIPDQDMWRLHLRADIYDVAGNLTVLKKRGPFDHHHLVLDRNLGFSMARHVSHYYKGKIKIDGQLDEWPELSSENFKNNDNLIHFRSCWNSDYLFLSVKVVDHYLNVPRDKELYVQMKNQEMNYLKLFLYDYIEFSFDPACRRSNHKHPDQPEFQICPDGVFQGNIIDMENKDQRAWAKNAIASASISGTVNNHSDLDSFYVVEVAIPWNELNVKPKNNLEMGFDIFNGDMEVPEAKHKGAFVSWSGVFTCNNDNPSEWGTLVLKKKTSKSWILWLGGIVLLIIVLLKFYREKARLLDEIAEIANPKVKVALEYLESHYQDQDLTIKKLADIAGLNFAYFGTMFHKETGKSYNDYLNDFRVEKAIGLMKKSPEKKISDIAFIVGFGTSDHFSRIFKKIKGVTPKQFLSSKMS
jgi:AraC-like DNA-binding protein